MRCRRSIRRSPRKPTARVKRALVEARAAVVLYLDDASDADKIDAIGIIRQRGDQDALGLLGGLPATASPAVAKAARRCRRLDREQPRDLERAAKRLVRAFARLGSAARRHRPRHHLRRDGRHQHGARRNGDARRLHDLRRAGGDPRAAIPALFDYSLAIAIPLAFLVAGLIGILIERGIIRFLYGRPLETLLATWGLSLILQQARAHRLRADQQGRGQSVLDERLVRSRADSPSPITGCGSSCSRS